MEARMERQTDMTKLKFTFHNFPNAPKNGTSIHIYGDFMYKVVEFSK